MWLLLLLVWIARLAPGGVDRVAGLRAHPLCSSVFGTPSWGWFPPGVTCTYPLPDGRTLADGPPRLRWAIATVLLLGGLGLVTARAAAHRPPR